MTDRFGGCGGCGGSFLELRFRDSAQIVDAAAELEALGCSVRQPGVSRLGHRRDSRATV